MTVVATIDNAPVPADTPYLVVLPRRYTIAQGATTVPRGGDPRGVRNWKAEVELDVVAGHTYVPDRTLHGDDVHPVLVDRGTDYPLRCLSLDAVAPGTCSPDCTAP